MAATKPASGKPATRSRDAGKTKAALLDMLGKGHTVERACEALKITRSAYAYHRSADPVFKAEADAILRKDKQAELRSTNVAARPTVPDFPEFCERYLGMRLFYHQLQWFDVLEGREPRDLHPSMLWEPGDPDRLVVNTPPEHAKSTTITMAYCVWRIYKDPNVRIIIVSKAQRLAVRFTSQIKQRLTHPAYNDLISTFGPPNGWDTNSQSWKQDLFYVSDDVRDPDEKDPTVQALGIGGAIYGARADLIILDDCVDNGNAAQYDDQKNWLETEVMSRLVRGAKLLVVGTRLAPKDLYSALREHSGADDFEDTDKWTYFAQPAVLEFAEKPEDWKTLWPRTNRPEGKDDVIGDDGLYRKHDGQAMRKKRGSMDPARWSRVYMQQAVAEDQTFQPDDVIACQQGRKPGLIPDSPSLGRPGGMSGLHVIGGIDPAASGYTAISVAGFDRKDNRRHLIDQYNLPNNPLPKTKELVKELTIRYGIKEWRVEGNAFQHHFAVDHEMVAWMAARGVIWKEHTTGRNKQDAELGVAAMSGLFKGRQVTLPKGTEVCRQFLDQLTTWIPNAPRGHKTDLVMSFWFCEIRFLELVNAGVNQNSHADNKYLSAWAKRQQRVIDFDEVDELDGVPVLDTRFWR